ncbi:MAG: hypothetical protein SynsKO_05850 [Synoicihabitans sp.]
MLKLEELRHDPVFAPLFCLLIEVSKSPDVEKKIWATFEAHVIQQQSMKAVAAELG